MCTVYCNAIGEHVLCSSCLVSLPAHVDDEPPVQVPHLVHWGRVAAGQPGQAAAQVGKYMQVM